MLTVTYGDLVAAAPALRELAASRTLAPSLTLRVYRLARVTDPALEDFGQARQKILDSYIERDADGNPAPVVENGQAAEDRVKLTDPVAFRNAMAELQAERIELAAEPLATSLFMANGKLEVSAVTMLQLGPLLIDDDEPAGSE